MYVVTAESLTDELITSINCSHLQWISIVAIHMSNAAFFRTVDVIMDFIGSVLAYGKAIPCKLDCGLDQVFPLSSAECELKVYKTRLWVWQHLNDAQKKASHFPKWS